jgi:nitrate reductase delta subunit
MNLYRLLSVLLDYPRDELRGAWEGLRAAAAGCPDTTAEERRVLTAFVDWAAAQPPIALQEAYVRTFDLNPDHALYVTHHLFEEQDRERGPALVQLTEFFRSQGYEPAGGELPDYLPLLLEFASTLEDDRTARLFLQQTAEVVDEIAARLEAAASPWAGLLRLLERRSRLATLGAAG